MFNDNDMTHKDRWDTYTLPFPHTKRTHSHGYHTSNMEFENGSVPIVSRSGEEADVEDAVDESQALLAKSSFAPSPYVHFAADNKKKKLGLAALTVLIFYEVSGGPFGIEDIVRAGGPFFALTG